MTVSFMPYHFPLLSKDVSDTCEGFVFLENVFIDIHGKYSFGHDESLCLDFDTAGVAYTSCTRIRAEGYFHRAFQTSRIQDSVSWMEHRDYEGMKQIINLSSGRRMLVAHRVRASQERYFSYPLSGCTLFLSLIL